MKFYNSLFLIFFISTLLISCSDKDEYTLVEESPVNVDLTLVPYQKLSDYHFFEGDLKNLMPSLNVIPYEPASALFSDYAHKKRFVWMPPYSKATFNGDGETLELPVGAVLIKNFYYDNVQSTSPTGSTMIVETRLMIRKSTGWIFANYVWNENQTEAFFDLQGSDKPIQWLENGQIKNVVYRIPNEVQCITCHKLTQTVNGQNVTFYTPIGIKPQNLNNNYNYGSETRNQLTKWIEQGYLDNNFTFPSENNSTINYTDASKPIEVRVRSYVDINCAHCHQNNRHCDYRPMRFAFAETNGNQTNMGVCVNTSDIQDFPTTLDQVINPGFAEYSMLFYRINTTNEAYRMPLHGRTLIHDEGVALIQEWINSLRECE